MTQKHKPIVIPIIDDAPSPHPADAPVIGDAVADETVVAYPKTRAGLWIWLIGLIASTLGAILMLKLWDFSWSLIARNDVLGWAFIGLLTATVIVFLAIVLREILAVARLGSLDRLKQTAKDARLAPDPALARDFSTSIKALYSNRPELARDLETMERQTGHHMDGFAIFDTVENTIMSPLDQRARREIEAAARQVATVTALVPIPLADVAVALTTNIRMIRKIADIYGGRSGIIGSWRLLRSVMAHLVATGAVAVGDDWLGSIFGGSLLAKLSRRFGEGMINAALTARVGRAAIDVCRPMPFHTNAKPRVSAILQRAMTGVFDKSPN